MWQGGYQGRGDYLAWKVLQWVHMWCGFYIVEKGQVFFIVWYCVVKRSEIGYVILGYDSMVFLGMMVWYYVSWNVLKRPTQPRSYSYHQLLTWT